MQDHRLVEIPPEQAEAVAEIVREHGIIEAMRRTGLGRAAILSVVGRRKAMRGTAALVREFIARRISA